MVERCSRFQCASPATARVAFDALGCMVWIDRYDADGPLDVGARGAGALCTRHADRLVPPRAWTVQDRRGPDLQLWSERPAPGPGTEPTRRSGTEPTRRSGTEPTRRSGTEPTRRSGTEPALGPLPAARRTTEREPGRVAVLEPPLPFEAPARRADAPAPPTGERTGTDTIDEIDRLLATPRSPLLARAFNAAHRGQAG